MVEKTYIIDNIGQMVKYHLQQGVYNNETIFTDVLKSWEGACRNWSIYTRILNIHMQNVQP